MFTIITTRFGPKDVQSVDLTRVQQPKLVDVKTINFNGSDLFSHVNASSGAKVALT